MTLFFLFILGLFVGSFLNMLIDRLPRGEQIVKGRSKCDHCKHVLGWLDLIPVISWLFLGGKCRYCQKKIPGRNTVVELLTAILFAVALVLTPFSETTTTILYSIIVILKLTIVSCFIVIFFIDLKHYIIPDVLTSVVGVVGVVLWFVTPTPLPWSNYLFSALGACAFFIFLVLITKGRGMGMGDVKFAFVMGLLLGFPGVVIALYISFLTGAVVSVILIARGKKRFGQTVPFGPFLVLGTLIVVFNLIPEPFVQLLVPYLYW